MAYKSRADGGLRELALFAGAGGGILGGHLLGWRTICAVEWEPYAASVLVARQNDGILPAFPIWDDVQTFDGHPWRGLVDVVSGGFPCQDISAAGKGAGINGERSGMWKHMARIVGEVRPKYVFVENSPLLVGRGLAVVLSDLADMGYDAQWFRLSASNCGAPHQRDRCWLVANANGNRSNGRRECGRGVQSVYESTTPFRSDDDIPASGCREAMADTSCLNEQGKQPCLSDEKERGGSIIRQTGPCSNGKQWWAVEPDVGRVANELAAGMDVIGADEI